MQSAPDDDDENAGNVYRASLPPAPCVKLEAPEEQSQGFYRDFWLLCSKCLGTILHSLNAPYDAEQAS